MDHAKPVDLVVTGNFKNHNVYHSFPPGKDISIADAIIDETKLQVGDKVLFRRNGRLVFVIFFGCWWKSREQGFVSPLNVGRTVR